MHLAQPALGVERGVFKIFHVQTRVGGDVVANHLQPVLLFGGEGVRGVGLLVLGQPSFEDFIAQHKDEITALQILYNRRYAVEQHRAPLQFAQLKELANALHAPPHLIDESALWQAYAAVKKDRVRGTTQRRLLTDLVSLVRFAMSQDNELLPYPERVQANFKAWLAQHQQANPAHAFTPEQQHWLEMIRDHIAANLGLDMEDFEYAPFNAQGGLGKVHQLFGAELTRVIEELNRELVA